MEVNREAYDFYEKGAEIGRLERGIGKLEAARTQELLLRWLPEKATVYDIGGGVGYYAQWLAGLGHKVTMVELAPAAVEYARSYQTAPYTALVGDARQLPLPDRSADAVLLLGPLYHLLEWESRLQALREAYRVLAPGGLVAAAGISAFSSLTWALTVYGEKNDFPGRPRLLGHDPERGGNRGAPPAPGVPQLYRPGLLPPAGGAEGRGGGGRVPQGGPVPPGGLRLAHPPL